MKTSKPTGRIIAESVRGEHKAWPLDPSYPANPSHEDAFKKDRDNQRVLWQIYDCAERGEPIPPWAATAFRDLLEKVMRCELTWSEAFGRIPAKGPRHRKHYKPSIQKLGKNIVKVGEAVQSYNGPKDEKKWGVLGGRLGLGRAVMKDYWRRYKTAHKS